MEALRRHLVLDKLVLAGHSAGTRLAVSYAAQFPERVDRLLLITPPPAWLVDEPSDADALIDARRGDPVFEAALAARDQGPDLVDEASFNAWQQAVAPYAYARWDDQLAAHAATGWWSFEAAKAFFSVPPPADIATRLARVTAPVLVVAGAQDCTTGVRPVLAVADLFPAGRAVTLDGCAHFPWLEQPAVFRAAVEDFLAA